MDNLQLSSTSQLIEMLLDPPNVTQFDKENKEKFLLFGALCLDCIWMWRNKVVHEGLLPSEVQKSKSFQKLVQEHWRLIKSSLPRDSWRSLSRWLKPRYNSFKLNCDAAVGLSYSSIAVVVRDWRGKLVFAHSKKVNTNVTLQAEADAIILALNIATKLNASHFVIESDSKICIDSIRAPGDQVPWRLLSFVSAVNSIFVELGSVSCSWVYREVI